MKQIRRADKRLRVWCVAMMAVLSLGVATQAHAVPLELALVVDSSGSISGAEWTLQMQGYNNAILDVMPTDGSVAVSVVRFADTSSVVRPMTTISSVADRLALANFFVGLSQSGNGSSTCISCGITSANSTLTGTATRSIIDVSTDGDWNVGVNPAGPSGTAGTSRWAVDNAAGKADAVNALGVGTGTAPNFAYGTDSFSMLAPNFAAFESALTDKLRRETTSVPEAETLSLLALAGLVLLLYSQYRTRVPRRHLA